MAAPVAACYTSCTQPQFPQDCVSWAARHEHLLTALRDGATPELDASSMIVDPSAAPVALGTDCNVYTRTCKQQQHASMCVHPVLVATNAAPTALVTATSAGGGVLASVRLTAAVVEACGAHDAAGLALLQERATAIASLTALLQVRGLSGAFVRRGQHLGQRSTSQQEYRSALQVLLPPDIASTSHHARWATALQALAAGTADGATQPPPEDDDAAAVLQRLRFAAAVTVQGDASWAPTAAQVAASQSEANAAAATLAQHALHTMGSSRAAMQHICSHAAHTLGTRILCTRIHVQPHVYILAHALHPCGR